MKHLLFSLALLAYPRAFRRRFGAEMRDDFARANPGTLHAIRTCGATIVNGFKERGSAVARWSFYPNSTPHLYEPSGRHFMFWDTLRADIRHTLRLAIKTPVFSTLTVLALALGIGATTAIFAVVNGVLLQSLPYRDDARLVNVWSYNTTEDRPRNPLSPANFRDVTTQTRQTRGWGAYTGASANLVGHGDPLRASAALVTSQVFPTPILQTPSLNTDDIFCFSVNLLHKID